MLQESSIIPRPELRPLGAPPLPRIGSTARAATLLLIAAALAALTVPVSAQDADAPKNGDKAQELKTITNSIGMKLVLIPAGKFTMGSPEDEKYRSKGEFQREVTIEKPFYIGAYEVTQAEYFKIREDAENNSMKKGDEYPIGNVSYRGALEFCRLLSEAEGETYRLPTEAEWEYACRAGTTTPFHYGDVIKHTDANFHAGYPYGTDVTGPVVLEPTPVGSYEPNAFGLYDMHGNMAEWCMDRLQHRKDQHILRGGNGRIAAAYCRSASRYARSYGWQWSGFRVVREVEPREGELEFPLTHGLDQTDLFSTAELITKFDEAMAQPAEKLLPPVYVFPAVDAERRVRADGPALGLVSNYTAAYTPQRRMAICLPNFRGRLNSAGLFKPGAKLDDESIRICLSALGGEHYVVPQLTEQGDQLSLSFAVHSLNDPTKAQTVIHQLPAEQITAVPELIARGIFDHLNASLTTAEEKHLADAHVRRSEDLVPLSKMVWRYSFGENNKDLMRLALRNPRCLLAWELFVFESNPAEDAIKRYQRMSRRLNCERLDICAAVRSTASDEVLAQLYEMAPRFQRDTYYLAAIALAAKNLSEFDLVHHVLDHWRKIEPGYSGCRERGRFLTDWGWQARGSGWAHQVSDEGWTLFAERLQMAKDEFEKAIELNPLGWEAHGELIRVAMGLELGSEYIDEHFDQAIKIRPRDRTAYDRMFQTLRFRWGGQTGDLLAFADLCIRTGFWEEGIPETGRRVFDELDSSVGSVADRQELYATPEVWDICLAYGEGARTASDEDFAALPEYRSIAKSTFAFYGALGDHFHDVAETYRELDKTGPHPRVFNDTFTFPFFRDRIFAVTETGQIQARAAARAALDEGNLDRAEDWIAQLKPETDAEQQNVARLKQAVKTARTLENDGDLELSAQQLHELFDGIDKNWTVDGDQLVCRLPAGAQSTIVLPFGIHRVTVSATIDAAGTAQSVAALAHTRAMRATYGLVFNFDYQHAQLYKGNDLYYSEPAPVAKIDFHMVLDTEQDQFAPTPDLVWRMGVEDDIPSGIGFKVVSQPSRPAVVKISNVRIKKIP